MRTCFCRRHGIERAHVVQPVGQLDQHDADVVDHRQEHLAQALGLLRVLARAWTLAVVGRPRDAAELGDAVDQPCDARAELGLDLLQRDRRVLDHVVERAAAIVSASSCIPARMVATAIGCMM